MTTVRYTLNKRDLSKEEKTMASKFYRGLTASSDTITETWFNEEGEETSSTTYYIFKGSWTPYGGCTKHGNKYVFARYSRYEAINDDFTDFAIDCDEKGNDHNIFETKHIAVENMTVKF